MDSHALRPVVFSRMPPQSVSTTVTPPVSDNFLGRTKGMYVAFLAMIWECTIARGMKVLPPYLTKHLLQRTMHGVM